MDNAKQKISAANLGLQSEEKRCMFVIVSPASLSGLDCFIRG